MANKTTTSLGALLLLLASTSSNAALLTYSVVIDTSAISGTSGALDAQFNPGNASAQSATATLDGFTTDGVLGGTVFNDGGASGSYPGSVDILNSDQILNAHYQTFTFGNSISFELTLSGPGVDTPLNNGVSSLFSFFLLDGFDDALLSTSVFDPVFTLDLNADGSASSTLFDSDNAGSASVVSLAELNTTSVPTPGLPLFLTALPLLFSASRKGRNTRSLIATSDCRV